MKTAPVSSCWNVTVPMIPVTSSVPVTRERGGPSAGSSSPV